MCLALGSQSSWTEHRHLSPLLSTSLPLLPRHRTIGSGSLGVRALDYVNYTPAFIESFKNTPLSTCYEIPYDRLKNPGIILCTGAYQDTFNKDQDGGLLNDQALFPNSRCAINPFIACLEQSPCKRTSKTRYGGTKYLCNGRGGQSFRRIIRCRSTQKTIGSGAFSSSDRLYPYCIAVNLRDLLRRAFPTRMKKHAIPLRNLIQHYPGDSPGARRQTEVYRHFVYTFYCYLVYALNMKSGEQGI